ILLSRCRATISPARANGGVPPKSKYRKEINPHINVMPARSPFVSIRTTIVQNLLSLRGFWTAWDFLGIWYLAFCHSRHVFVRRTLVAALPRCVHSWLKIEFQTASPHPKKEFVPNPRKIYNVRLFSFYEIDIRHRRTVPRPDRLRPTHGW